MVSYGIYQTVHIRYVDTYCKPFSCQPVMLFELQYCMQLWNKVKTYGFFIFFRLCLPYLSVQTAGTRAKSLYR